MNVDESGMKLDVKWTQVDESGWIYQWCFMHLKMKICKPKVLSWTPEQFIPFLSHKNYTLKSGNMNVIAKRECLLLGTRAAWVEQLQCSCFNVASTSEHRAPRQHGWNCYMLLLATSVDKAVNSWQGALVGNSMLLLQVGDGMLLLLVGNSMLLVGNSMLLLLVGNSMLQLLVGNSMLLVGNSMLLLLLVGNSMRCTADEGRRPRV